MRMREVLFAVLAAGVLLTGCSKTAARDERDAEDEVDTRDYESQIELLYEQSDVWEYQDSMLADDADPDDVVNYCYAVSDLDGDGMLEVITEVRLMQYEGEVDSNTEYSFTSYTYNVINELSEDGSIHAITMENSDDDGFYGILNIITDPLLRGYYDGKTPVFMLIDGDGNTITSGSDEFENYRMSYYRFYIQDDIVNAECAFVSVSCGDMENPSYTYYDGEGNEISYDEYIELNQDYTLHQQFMTFAGRFRDISEDELFRSYEIFLGIYEPEPTRETEDGTEDTRTASTAFVTAIPTPTPEGD